VLLAELLISASDELNAALLLAELSALLAAGADDALRLALLDTGVKPVLWLLPLKLAAPPPPPQAQRPATKLLANNMRAIGIVISIMLRSCQGIING
jgi:hypothetical protein